VRTGRRAICSQRDGQGGIAGLARVSKPPMTAVAAVLIHTKERRMRRGARAYKG
jgi:hypothetical protein